MAIEQHRRAKGPDSAFNEPAQSLMVRLVELIDARHRLADRQQPLVDLLRFADDPRDRAEAAGDAQRTGVGVGRQPALEHQRIEFERLAIKVEKGAGKVRAHERRAQAHARRE